MEPTSRNTPLVSGLLGAAGALVIGGIGYLVRHPDLIQNLVHTSHDRLNPADEGVGPLRADPRALQELAELRIKTEELDRRFTNLSDTVEQRHRKISGMISRARSGKQTSDEDDEQPEIEAGSPAEQLVQQLMATPAAPQRPNGRPQLRHYGR